MLFSRQLHRRFLSKTTNIKHHQHQQWSQTVKQVTKSNFHESLNDLKTQIHNSDYIAISSKKTGIFSSPWKRFLPFIDTPETAYLKAKESAEKYQILQFSVCPFTLRTETASSNAKAVAYPYNFQLFPREEGYVVMPSYSFSCQTSCLTSMAREGFDFNECIYEGISYLSREQEYVGKHRAGSSVSDVQAVNSSATADAIYLEKIKSHVQRWRRFCENKIKETEDPLLRSLRKMILGGEMHGSRPCVNIDVCNERHVQLVQELVNEFYDDLVPLVIPHKGGGPKLVRVVLTSSKEDKNLFQTELRDLEEEQNKQVRGFREVIELISTSQKPIVTHNCLREFTFIHSKFLGPLPLALEEFSRSLHPVFPYVLDVNHLMKKIGPLKKATNISAAIAYMKRQFFVPLDMEIGLKGT
ncbi:hypothetical protein GIB67_012542 [Kingdonia uniflora]|uniref:Uncharacterized protein n=1 Tax=Kingdonia uniflora TaxID=39325 RepID=A0A7J7N5T4_9MAGN|nr:hypothetical protein GIB67_012542 [Kingdonia uniflora]